MTIVFSPVILQMTVNRHFSLSFFFSFLLTYLITFFSRRRDKTFQVFIRSLKNSFFSFSNNLEKKVLLPKFYLKRFPKKILRIDFKLFKFTILWILFEFGAFFTGRIWLINSFTLKFLFSTTIFTFLFYFSFLSVNTLILCLFALFDLLVDYFRSPCFVI